MTKPEFVEILASLSASFPGAINITPESREAWYKTLSDVDGNAIKRAAALLAKELEYLRPGSNIAAILRNKAKPQVTTASVSSMLQQASELARKPGGDPYAFLTNVDQKLLEAAERCDIFARDISSETLGYRIHAAAQQYLEQQENAKRGYLPPQKVDGKHLLEAPGNAPMSEEERQRNLERAREMVERFSRKAA